MLASCDSDVKYTPGEQVSPDCMNVYFLADNPEKHIFASDELGDDWSIEVKMGRKKTDTAVDIPLSVEAGEEVFTVPATAHFDAGEAETSVKVSFQGIKLCEAQRLNIRIPDEYIDQYSRDIEGAGRLNTSVLVSEWRRIVRNAEIYDYDQEAIWYFADIYWLAGDNRFRFMNFLESGINITFKLDNPDGNVDANTPSTWEGMMMPLDNFSQWEGVDYFRWFLWDDSKGKRAAWTTEYCGIPQNNIYFRNETYYNNFNIVDGGVEGAKTCHGCLRKMCSNSKNRPVVGQHWIYFYYPSSDINLDGWGDEE